MGRRDDIEAEIARLSAELVDLPEGDDGSAADAAAADIVDAGADAVEAAARAVEHAAAAVEQMTEDDTSATDAAVQQAQETADAAVDIAATAAIIAADAAASEPEPGPAEADVEVDVVVPHDTTDTTDAPEEVEHAPQSTHWSNRKWFGGKK